jgi:PIN domain nuclease of toxin-antitoxin system
MSMMRLLLDTCIVYDWLMGEIKYPFDRLLIAQAKYETLRIVTFDAVFQNYLDDILLIRK